MEEGRINEKIYEKSKLLLDSIIKKYNTVIFSQGYVPLSKAQEIIREEVEQSLNLNGKKIDEQLIKKIYRVFWWCFSECCEVYCAYNGNDDKSGIYELDPNKIKERFEKYYPEIEKKLKV